jgi:hypothetical protein
VDERQLTQKIRMIYQRTMEAGETAEQAMARCIAILRYRCPDESEDEVNKRIAKMIAEKPIEFSRLTAPARS